MKTTPFSLHSASPRLRTGEPQHLVCFWPSPTSMARREHHLCAPGVRWWVRTVRFCVWKGCIKFPYIFMPPFSLHSASLRLCTVEPLHLVCFWLSPTSMTIGNIIVAHPKCGGGSERSGSVCISMRNIPIIVAFGITPSLHGRTTAPSLLF
jgi:hypothetical protein